MSIELAYLGLRSELAARYAYERGSDYTEQEDINLAEMAINAMTRVEFMEALIQHEEVR